MSGHFPDDIEVSVVDVHKTGDQGPVVCHHDFQIVDGDRTGVVFVEKHPADRSGAGIPPGADN